VRFSAWAGALLAMAATVAYVGLAQWLFVKQQMVVDMAGPLLTLAVAYVPS